MSLHCLGILFSAISLRVAAASDENCRGSVVPSPTHCREAWRAVRESLTCLSSWERKAVVLCSCTLLHCSVGERFLRSSSGSGRGKSC